MKPFLLDDLSFLVKSISELLNFSLVTFELFRLCLEFRLNFNVLFSELFIFVFKLNQSVVHLLRFLGDLSDSSVFLLCGFEKLIDLFGARLMNDVEVGFKDFELSLADDRRAFGLCALGMLLCNRLKLNRAVNTVVFLFNLSK